MNTPKSTTAYSSVLGFPPELASPNYYQFLGLEEFTDDSQAILEALTRLNRNLQSLQNNADLYQDVKLLEKELGTVSIVLRDPEKKREYDRQLRQPAAQDQETFEFNSETITIPQTQTAPAARNLTDEQQRSEYDQQLIIPAELGEPGSAIVDEPSVPEASNDNSQADSVDQFFLKAAWGLIPCALLFVLIPWQWASLAAMFIGFFLLFGPRRIFAAITKPSPENIKELLRPLELIPQMVSTMRPGFRAMVAQVRILLKTLYSHRPTSQAHTNLLIGAVSLFLYIAFRYAFLGRTMSPMFAKTLLFFSGLVIIAIWFHSKWE